MLNEIPLPVLDVSIDRLVVETKDKFTGQFTIKNTGGGLLCGRVISRLPGLSFHEENFSGPSHEAVYSWDASQAGIKTGQSMEGVVYVSSNGGEKAIPITLKYTRMSILSTGGTMIANIKDFYEYSLVNSDGARRMFTDSEFYMLLLATGYPYLEVYENLHKDANRERAMDNFFILSGLKEETKVFAKQHRLEFSSNNNDLQKGRLEVCKTDSGYALAEVVKAHGADWLNLSTGRLSTLDFNEQFVAAINFTIDPSKVTSSFAREEIIIGHEPEPDGSNVVEIIFRRPIPIKARLNRETFRFDDTGQLIVHNNTGSTITVEPFCQENYIRFGAKRFVVAEYEEIPFDIKLTAFLGAQVYFRKIAYFKTAIEVKFGLPGAWHKKNLPMIVGGW